MAGERRTPALGEQAEAIIEVVGEAAQPEEVDAAGRELDGERDAVEPAADVDHQRGIGIVHLEPAVAPEARSTKSCTAGNRIASSAVRPVGRRRQVERTEAIDPLAGRAQRLPAGGEHMHAAGATDDALGQRRCRLDHVLAIIEDDQHVPAGEGGSQAGDRVLRRDREAERRGEGARDRRGSVTSERSTKRAPSRWPLAALSARRATVVLPIRAGPDDGDEPALTELRGHARHALVAADDVKERRRQVMNGRRSSPGMEAAPARPHEPPRRTGSRGRVH